MTPQILYAASFRRDAEAVWDAVGADAPERADAVLDAVDETLDLLARYPLSGRSRPELASGVRSFPSGRYLVFYIPRDEGGIVALRLLHGARDIDGLF